MTKTINALLSFSIILLFAGCLKKDIDPSDNEKIIDTWTVNSYEATIDIDATTQAGHTISSTSEVELPEIDYKITFSEIDFTTDGDYNVSIKSTANGDPQTNLYSLDDITEEGTYQLTEGENMLNTERSLFNLDVHIEFGIEVTYLKEAQNMNYEFADNGNLILTQDQVFVIEDSLGTTTYKLVVRAVLVN